MPCPRKGWVRPPSGEKWNPASSRWSSARVCSAMRPSPSVQRCSVGSWETTSSPSRVACRSSSRMSVRQRSTALRKARRVFSGASSAPPRWAMCRVGRRPSRKGWRMGGSVCSSAARRRALPSAVPPGVLPAQAGGGGGIRSVDLGPTMNGDRGGPGARAATRHHPFGRLCANDRKDRDRSAAGARRGCMSRVVTPRPRGRPRGRGSSPPLATLRATRRIRSGMAVPRKRKNVVKKRAYTFARLAVSRAQVPEPQRLLRVWRRVLERRLRTRLRTDVAVEIHDNTHTMVTFQRRRGGAGGCGCTTCSWPRRTKCSRRSRSSCAAADAPSSAVLDRFIERNSAFIRRVSPAQLRKRLRIEPVGRHHDLLAHLHGAQPALLPEPHRRDHHLRAGAAEPAAAQEHQDGLATRRTRRSSASTRRWTSRRCPGTSWSGSSSTRCSTTSTGRAAGDDGRRCVHPPEFMEHERRFHDFQRAQAWEDENLDLLLRARVG